MGGSRTLTDLPVELVYELYLLALSPSLPHTSKYIYTAVKTASAVLHAHYILGRHAPSFCRTEKGLICVSGEFLTRALRYPICTISVLQALSRLLAKIPISLDIPDASVKDTFELPKRIFRFPDHSSASSYASSYGPNSDPLPLLQFLWQKGTSLSVKMASKESHVSFMQPSANSHSGYPLFQAVHAQFLSLIQFLLDRGANPRLKNCAPVKVAILAKDLTMVKLLVECEPEHSLGSSKKRKRSDRLTIDTCLLDLAIRTDAREIVEYFMIEKGSVPEMKSLRHIM